MMKPIEEKRDQRNIGHLGAGPASTRRQRVFSLFSCFLLLVLFAAGAFAEASATVTERYLAAYQAYRKVVEAGLPFEQVKVHLDAYLSAKAAFDRQFQKTSLAEITAGSGLPENGIPPGVPVGTASISRFLTETPTASFPTEIRSVVDQIRRASHPQDISTFRRHLETFLHGLPTGEKELGFLVSYEIADALDRQGLEVGHARKLLSQIALSSSSPDLRGRAKARLSLLQAGIEQRAWKQRLVQSSSQMHAAYSQYQKTSWLAFPVKLARFGTYMSRANTLRNTQSGYRDFQATFEEIAAPFVPSVETVFDQFMAADTSQDDNTRIRLLYKNSDAWFSRWEIISQARHSIDVQYFIVEKDVFGMSLLGLFLQKAREGVQIRFMIDARGANKLSHLMLGRDYLQELAQFPNVEIKVFNTIDSNLALMLTDIRRMVSSNHDKILVVDNQYAVIGGRNIANEYLADAEDEPTAWRDCDVLIESAEVAGQMVLAFSEEFKNLKSTLVKKDLFNLNKRDLELESMYKTMDSFMRQGRLYKPTGLSAANQRSLEKCNSELSGYPGLKGFALFDLWENAFVCPVKIIDKHSMSGPRDDATEQIIRFIDGSKREILIQNPYIVLTPRAEAALKRAGRRGVRVLFHTNSPQTSDSFPTEAVMLVDWRSILQMLPGCRIFGHVGNGQLHAKNFVFDGKIGIVGTYNLDYLSEQVNSEVLAVVRSPGFSSVLRTEIISDMNHHAKEYRLAGPDTPEFGPQDVEGGKNMWLVRLISKMGFLRPLF
jgi:phosphatidylserine/phosphatidylglycerophosphate/cardiolipin synthase-like enzyme